MKAKEATEHISARGHVNVQATNKTTFEITKETHLTRRGDCIIAVAATKGAAGLKEEFKIIARSKTARITITIKVDNEQETVTAWGHPQLSFTHPTDLVIRKSDFVCGRTLAVRADKAACDLSRSLVEKLRSPTKNVEITLTVEETGR